MCNEKILAAVALPALLAVSALAMPAVAAGQEGMVVVRDAQTGQMRPPTPAELKALQPQQGSMAKSAAPLRLAPQAIVARKDGTRQLHLGDRAMVYSVVTRAADGKLVEQCVQGESAAQRALAQPATPNQHNEEHSHETR
jgi:hypothetical protein